WRGVGDPQGAQDLRNDRRRQRQQLVHQRRNRSALERQQPRRVEDGPRQRVPGGPNRTHPARLGPGATHLGVASSATTEYFACAYSERMSFLSSLPTLVLGSSLTKAQRSGSHHRATF